MQKVTLLYADRRRTFLSRFFCVFTVFYVFLKSFFTSFKPAHTPCDSITFNTGALNAFTNFHWTSTD